MSAGAPDGNNNAGKGADWRDAIRHALAKKGKEEKGDGPAYIRGLQRVAEKFIEAAEDGESWAMKELGDRMDGKAPQAITGADGNELFPTTVNVNVVKPND